MPTYTIPGNNSVIASGYAPGDKSRDGYLLEKMAAAIVEHVKDDESVVPWDEQPYRYALVYDTEPNPRGLHSWKLFEIKDPSAIEAQSSPSPGVTVLLCRPVWREASRVVVMTPPRPRLLQDLRDHLEAAR